MMFLRGQRRREQSECGEISPRRTADADNPRRFLGQALRDRGSLAALFVLHIGVSNAHRERVCSIQRRVGV